MRLFPDLHLALCLLTKSSFESDCILRSIKAAIVELQLIIDKTNKTDAVVYLAFICAAGSIVLMRFIIRVCYTASCLRSGGNLTH